MFDELAESLESRLEELNEEGFIDTYTALSLNKHALRMPKKYRSALSDL